VSIVLKGYNNKYIVITNSFNDYYINKHAINIITIIKINRNLIIILLFNGLKNRQMVVEQ